MSSGKYYTQLAVIGAGHAGIEAALAGARMGIDTVLFTMSLDAVGNMPCNPAIGGTGKGQLVFEIDALGGQMSIAADAVTLQSRTLNEGKGAAVHSKRVQADRAQYRLYMKQVLENQPGLRLIQAEITEILFEGEGKERKVSGVVTKLGTVWSCSAAVVCTGTFLNGRVIVGEHFYSAGPDGMLPAVGLTDSLKSAGIEFMRFKTGTPARVHRDSIDFSALEIHPGEKHITPFSILTDEDEINRIVQTPCHIVYTNAKTHALIRDNLSRSPLYSGIIKGTGPRYCPSIEDKVVRFADKERHQLFIEPCGASTKEMYIQGFSTSLPEEIQSDMLHTLPGMERAVIMRSAYAIEYDCVDPTQMYPTLEFKNHSGLYGAGQLNGTSGYEEAAAQGLVAGINAALKLLGRKPLILTRESSYIGTLIDDLVTKGTNEPYRIMTSRSEFRLLLRQDNAGARLYKLGRECGLLDEERYERFKCREETVAREIKRVRALTVPPSEKTNELLTGFGTTAISTGVKLDELCRRPQLDYGVLEPLDPDRPKLPPSIAFRVQTEIKYEGYVKKQLAAAERTGKLYAKKLPDDIDYTKIGGIRLEAQQKLNKIRPYDIGQASRISGVSPADISVLLIYLTQNGL